MRVILLVITTDSVDLRLEIAVPFIMREAVVTSFSETGTTVVTSAAVGTVDESLTTSGAGVGTSTPGVKVVDSQTSFESDVVPTTEKEVVVLFANDTRALEDSSKTGAAVVVSFSVTGALVVSSTTWSR